MASWYEFCGVAGRFGGTQISETAWRFDVQGRGEARTQRVFVFHEIMKPDFEFIQVKSAFVMMDEVDCEQVLKGLGQLQVGAIGYSPRFDEAGNPVNGFLNITSSIPLLSLDLSEPSWFFLYLNVLGQASDDIEQRLAASGPGADLF